MHDEVDRTDDDKLVRVRKDRIRPLKASSIQVGGWFSEQKRGKKDR